MGVAPRDDVRIIRPAAILDERAAWEREKGDALENAILSGLGKRGGKALIISTSAPDDANTFSRWLDEPPPGTYVQEHRPPFGLPADDAESLLLLGNCNLILGNTQAAIANFTRLSSTSAELSVQAKWFLALAHLRNGDERRARPLLNEIAGMNVSYTPKAKEILDELE